MQKKKKFTIFCIESRIEKNKMFYGRFLIGPFQKGEGLTVANALRRTLLSQVSGLALIATEIENAFHEFSTIPGVRETVLDILFNLKEIILTSKFQLEQPEFGFLFNQGPAFVQAKDLNLPFFLQIIDPKQYIATLTCHGFLHIKFFVCQEKHCIFFSNFLSKIKKKLPKKSKYCFSEFFPMDSLFFSVKKVNFLLQEENSFFFDSLKEEILFEIWTNGSIHPKKALLESIKKLIFLFLPFHKKNFFPSDFFDLREIFFFKLEKLNKSKKGKKKLKKYKVKQNSFLESKAFSLEKLKTIDLVNFDLSFSLYVTLKRAKINCLENLIQYSSDDLFRLTNFGKNLLIETENFLHQLGLQLSKSSKKNI